MSTSRFRESATAADDVSPAPGGHDGDSSLGPLTLEQIQRWAALVADGGGEFPAELEAPDRERLAVEVRRRLRARLVTLVARAIARDLYHRERVRTDTAPDSGGAERCRRRCR